MFNKIAKEVSSFKANSAFERARLRATFNKDKKTPSESNFSSSVIHELVILNTLMGQDPETLADEALKILLIKIENSESSKKWNYILKYLVIYDRAIEKNLFLEQFSQMNLELMHNFSCHNETYRKMLISELILNYYLYLKAKATAYNDIDSVFCVPRESLNFYLVESKTEFIIKQGEVICDLIKRIFTISESGDKGYLKYQICQYSYLLMLQSLLRFFHILHLIVIILIDEVKNMKMAEALPARNIYKVFVNESERLTNFISKYQFIPGFEMVTGSMYKGSPNSLDVFDKRIEDLISGNVDSEINEEEKSFDQEIIVIQRSPSKSSPSKYSFRKRISMVNWDEQPNIKLEKIFSKAYNRMSDLYDADIFDNFTNHYSSDRDRRFSCIPHPLSNMIMIGREEEGEIERGNARRETFKLSTDEIVKMMSLHNFDESIFSKLNNNFSNS